MVKPLILGSDNHPIEVIPNTTSAGVADANKLVMLDSSGKLDISLLPNGIGADTKIAPASENLSAGDIVNLWNNSGTLKVRKADASGGVAKKAIGFVSSAVTSGQDATVYLDGTISGLSGLTLGTTYALSHSTPGGVIALASATTTAGHILQEVGYATSATELLFKYTKPIIRA